MDHTTTRIGIIRIVFNPRDNPFSQTVFSELFSQMIEISVELSTFDDYGFEVIPQTAFFDEAIDYTPT